MNLQRFLSCVMHGNGVAFQGVHCVVACYGVNSVVTFDDVHNRFCDPMKKKNWCDVGERNRGSWLLRPFLKPLFKMPSIFC